MSLFTDDRRRFLAGGLFATAAWLYVLAFLLPFDGVSYPGWQVMWEVARVLVEEDRRGAEVACILGLLQPTALFPLAAGGLAAGYRTFGRVAAVGLTVPPGLLLGLGVLANPAFASNVIGDPGRVVGQLTWLACFLALAAAAFVWPRPAAPPE
jgi:hypothetical protein